MKNCLRITIPNSGMEELDNYHKSILSLLSNFEITACDQELKGNIKAVYELLSHLQPEQSFVDNTNSIQHELGLGNS